MTAETTTPTSPASTRTPQPRRGRSATLLAILAFTAGGIYVGMRWHTTFERWLVPSTGSDQVAASEPSSAGGGTAKKQLWTCGMHPQVIQDHPGDCPICHMKLTPLMTADAGSGSAPHPLGDSTDASVKRERKVKYWHDPMMNPPYISDRPGQSPMGMDLVPVYEEEARPTGAAVVIDPAIVQNMGVRTVAATRGTLTQRVRATATIVEPESARTDINLRVSGWIQKLYADTDGVSIRKGDPLFDLYSPDLRLAIEELIAATRASKSTTGDQSASLQGTSDALIAAARLRLETLGLTPEQIEQLSTLEHAPATVTFTSPIDGVVVDKANVYKGSSVLSGQLVLRLADRSTMWVEARVPEGAVGRLRVGQRAAIAVDGVRGREITGDVVFIHPNLDEMTRTAVVRVAVPNPEGTLRAGMFAVAAIDAGSTTEVTIVPREAVIDSGESQVVFVSTGKGRYEPRRVRTGESGVGGLVQIVSGVEPGESVVASGQFLLDSESRLREAIAKFLGQGAAQSSASPAPASPYAGHATAPDAKAPAALIDHVVIEYLKIAEPLGQEQPDTPPAKVGGLLAAIDTLMEKADGADAKQLVTEARQSVTGMQSQSTAKQRDLFKRVSADVIALVDAMPPSASVAANLYVANCPMAKADWLQRSQNLANPYYAEDMKECGTIVRRAGEKPTPGKRGAP